MSARRRTARRAPEAAERERAFWDAAAAHVDPAAAPAPAPAEHERFILDALGPVDGLRVLDLGCGAGGLTLELAARGARVTALDLSPAMVRVTAERARRQRPQAPVECAVGRAEDMPFANGSFDRVAGGWILHHVDVAAAAREVRRVLRPGGEAVFFENQARNRLLVFARRRLLGAPGLHRVGTADEHPLSAPDFDAIRTAFDGAIDLAYPSFYCFEALSRALHHRAHRPLRALDTTIHRRLPALRPWSYHVLVTAKARP